MRAQWFSVLVLSLLLSPAAPSFAAPPAKGAADAQKGAADAQTAARARGEEGLRLFETGQWSEAFTAFEQADAIYHAPTLVLFMARCRRNQGRLIEAEVLYNKAAAEPVPKGAPEQFVKAVASARAELDNIHKRIPSVRVTLRGAAAARAVVSIDGVPLRVTEISSRKPLDPGDHEVVASVEGGVSARKKISLQEGEEVSVELDLNPPVPEETPKGSRVPAVIAFSVGGVGVAVGAITGGIALSKIADIKSRCTPDGHCLKSDKPAAATAQTLSTTSAIGFGVGGAGIVAGALLWWLRPGTPKPSDKPSAHLEIGPGSVMIGGQF
jgi:hypothetical protein